MVYCSWELMYLKDIPFFDTEFGVASLILKEIPYRGIAYVYIRSTLEPEKLLEECVTFCRMCGADRIEATGHEALEARYSLVTAVVAMQCSRDTLGPSEACLFPVTEETVDRWLEVYNAAMEDVPNAAYMDRAAGKELLRAGDGYFVHRDGVLLGIGKAAGDTIDAVVSCQRGMGAAVVRALASALTEDMVRLTVADQNTRAVRLYERLGFVPVEELSRWYRVL